MSHEKQLHLAISICKKLFFDYQLFFQKNNWGNPDILLDSINLAEQSTLTTVDTESIKRIRYKLEQITPDTEDFGDASYALNACVAVWETLEFLLDENSEHIYNIGTSLTDTIDFKIQENEELTDDQINRHPMMIETRKLLLELTK